MMKCALAVLCCLLGVTFPSAELNERIDHVLRQENGEDKFKELVLFEELWYLYPASYRYDLSEQDTVIIGRLLSDHETTIEGAAILVKSPESLKYIEFEIESALEREATRRRETLGKFPAEISTGYPEYDALLCLDELVRYKSVNETHCYVINLYEREFTSALRDPRLR